MGSVCCGLGDYKFSENHADSDPDPDPDYHPNPGEIILFCQGTFTEAHYLMHMFWVHYIVYVHQRQKINTLYISVRKKNGSLDQ